MDDGPRRWAKSALREAHGLRGAGRAAEVGLASVGSPRTAPGPLKLPSGAFRTKDWLLPGSSGVPRMTPAPRCQQDRAGRRDESGDYREGP